MRLHRLRVEAFGPFAGTEEVDFDELAGLFLLHGPTGAGKSSVLDAVCFALYGQVPGARASGRARLRSDHAAAGTAPRVVLEVTLGGRRLEVTRSPEWQRPKKRGTGTTREPASTDVRELVDGSWQVLVGRRSDEAGLLLRDLLGMGLDQFTKVVLLPQGDFAAFLRAGAEQRAEVLGRLFDIDRYADAETWLREERVRLAHKVEDADAERDRLVARAHQAASSITGALASGADEIALADPPGPEVVEALASVAAQAAREAMAAFKSATANAEVAARRLSEGIELSRRLDRRSELEARLRELEDGTEHHLANIERLATGRRAAQLRLLVRRLDETSDRAVGAGATLEAAAEQLPTVGSPTDPGGPAADPFQLLTVRQAELARLADARSLESDLAGLRSRLTRSRDEQRSAQVAVDQAIRELGDLDALTIQARTELEAHRAQTATTPGLERSLGRAAAILEAARELASSDAELAALEDARREARDVESGARSAWLDAREQRIAGMAAELALALQPGVPCTVCGSPEHPHPAVAAGDHVDAGAERAAQQLHEATAETLHGAEQRLASALTARAALLKRSEGVDLDSATSEVARLSDELDRATAAADVVRIAEQALTGAADGRDDVMTRRQAAEVLQASAASRIGELQPRVEELEVSLTAAIGPDEDVDARQRRLARDIAALTQYVEAARALASLAAQRESLAKDVLTSVEELGFTDLADARAALVPDADLARLQADVDRHDRLRSDVQALLADPELAAVPGQLLPDLPALRAENDARAAELTSCTDRQAITTQATTALRSLVEQVRTHEEVHHDLRRRAAHVDELSRCLDGTGGGNSRRMRLSAFVLAARLEEVATAATERLMAMSDGRFALSHTDALAKSGARSGLGLQVLDSWTGVARDTSTLSGGETFLASLALALGLADVVQAEAGGTKIETLFVDEGFGTLDEDTLEEVMGVLDGLRDGGRTVGLVSHVRELRSRIPSQLEVRRTRTGSSIDQHSAMAG